MVRFVSVTTGSRLHFGPLACGAGVGRRFGGIGLMLDDPRCRVTTELSEADRIEGEEQHVDRLREVRDRIRRLRPGMGPVTIRVVEDIPAHRGLGAGTQLSLAVAEGLSILAGDSNLTDGERAARAGRGDRSAIGLHGFRAGGFLVDAGKRADEPVGALACRLPIPAAWRFVLVCRTSFTGLSGDQERAAFASLPGMPPATSERLSRIVLGDILPAIGTGDAAAFGHGLTEYGRLVGDYFAPVQGSHFSDASLWDYSERRRTSGRSGLVQTSWGPTAVLCCGSVEAADREAKLLIADLGPEYDIRVAAPRNAGALVDVQS